MGSVTDSVPPVRVTVGVNSKQVGMSPLGVPDTEVVTTQETLMVSAYPLMPVAVSTDSDDVPAVVALLVAASENEPASVAVPESVVVCGEPAALSATLTVAVRALPEVVKVVGV